MWVVDLSVGLSTVKPNSFFIQDVRISGTWSTMASWIMIRDKTDTWEWDKIVTWRWGLTQGVLNHRIHCMSAVCVENLNLHLNISLLHCFYLCFSHVSPHLPTRDGWPHSQHPTTVNQTPQIFYCLFQSLVSGRSAACAEGEEGGTGLNGASLGTLMKQNKLVILSAE